MFFCPSKRCEKNICWPLNQSVSKRHKFLIFCLFGNFWVRNVEWRGSQITLKLSTNQSYCTCHDFLSGFVAFWKRKKNRKNKYCRQNKLVHVEHLTYLPLWKYSFKSCTIISIIAILTCHDQGSGYDGGDFYGEETEKFFRILLLVKQLYH